MIITDSRMHRDHENTSDVSPRSSLSFCQVWLILRLSWSSLSWCSLHCLCSTRYMLCFSGLNPFLKKEMQNRLLAFHQVQYLYTCQMVQCQRHISSRTDLFDSFSVKNLFIDINFHHRKVKIISIQYQYQCNILPVLFLFSTEL